MSEQSQFTAHIEEARTAIDGALAHADLVARHEIVHSQSFHQLVVFLHDAAEAIRRIGDQGDTVRREAALQPLAHGAGRPLCLVTNDAGLATHGRSAPSSARDKRPSPMPGFVSRDNRD